LVEPLKKVGVRLEESVKEDVVKVDGGKPEKEVVAEFGHAAKPEDLEKEVVEAEKTESKAPESTEPPENKTGGIRFEIKYTAPKKKKPKSKG
jgi:hypothetical protein